MEDKNKDKLPKKDLESEKRSDDTAKDSTEVENSSVEVENQSTQEPIAPQSVDTSEEETKKLGSETKKEEVEEGRGQVTSFFKLDEKGEKQIKDLLEKELKVEVQDIKKDFLIIFGLFASFVTFISINVQVFKNAENIVELIGVISISLSFIIFFALVINNVVKQQLEWSDLKKPVYIINLVFLILGVVFIAYGENKSNNKIQELHQRTVADSINIEKLNYTIDNLRHQFIYRDTVIIRLSKSVEELKLIDKKQTVEIETDKGQQPTKAPIPNKGSGGKLKDLIDSKGKQN